MLSMGFVVTIAAFVIVIVFIENFHIQRIHLYIPFVIGDHVYIYRTRVTHNPFLIGVHTYSKTYWCTDTLAEKLLFVEGLFLNRPTSFDCSIWSHHSFTFVILLPVHSVGLCVTGWPWNYSNSDYVSTRRWLEIHACVLICT